MKHSELKSNAFHSLSQCRDKRCESVLRVWLRDGSKALLVVLVCLGLPSLVRAQSAVGCFGYSDTWASYSPPDPVVAYPATQMLITAASSSVVVNPDANSVAANFGAVGCGEVGCGESSGCGCAVCPCDESCRKFAVDVSSVFFRRNRLNSRQLIFNPIATNEQIDASQFDLGFAPGIEAGVITYNQKSQTDFEFRSIWLNEWASGVGQSFTGGAVQITSDPPLATTGPRTASTSYDSRFWSAEFNLRYRLQSMPRTTLLAGFRTMRLDDEFNARLADPANVLPDELVQSVTRNRLFGFQIGADHVLRNCDSWCLRLKGRAGMYGNAGSQESALISLATPPVIFPASGGSSDLAFHAELGAEAKIRLSNCANLLFGYRVMTLDGLAIATDQLGAINFLNQAGYHSNGLVVMQAINVGLEFVY